ncbi:L-threonylcarbamoyladenylate synthase [Motilimonas pumila]|uniref:Threonylcarbamoyl-AMP synthase n=1 Tax=Motilimonas pumila TaxID=2303987 RepID=A0A418YJ67_9GAMM|nr:L-threonylcarbamoyladenylate synthase [Motilimonas pumila]RJG50667.1 threonylcarbamoyl-AMP synthase [Motilimonas pumila]
MEKNTQIQIAQAVQALIQGEVIAYPTEAVYGVGCDPDNRDAIAALLALKQRPKSKGLILVAANMEQLHQYIDLSQLSESRLAEINASWPGPNTWVMPAQPHLTEDLIGQFDTIAVRVSDHPLVQQLCRQFGKPITSTSANLSGQAPGLSALEVERQLAGQIKHIIDGPLGGLANPTHIRDARTGATIRQG